MQPSLELGVHVSGPSPAKRLRLVVLNDSAPVVRMLCDWFTQHGHHCDAVLLSDMPRAHEEVGHFVSAHRPDVVIYDIGMPYASSWDLLEAIRMSPALQSQPFVITTPNKAKLEQAVGRTAALEIGGRGRDLRRLLKAVEEAADVTRQSS
jgi:CheY-like chemotaxis protein